MSSLGLALGGGGARGVCHVGVMEVLEENKIVPDVIAGTSMGGMIGAFAAAGFPPTAIGEIVTGVAWRRLIEWRPGQGMLSGRGLTEWLAEYLPPTFEELKTPLALTATDMVTGRVVFLTRGDLYQAIQATTAYPGATQPVKIGPAQLADGGVLNQIPVDAAVFLGAHRVIAVNATVTRPRDVPTERVWNRGLRLGAFENLMRAVDLMQAQLTEARLSMYRPDVLLSPTMEGISIGDFHKMEATIADGREAAEAAIAQIKTVAAMGIPGAVSAGLPVVGAPTQKVLPK